MYFGVIMKKIVARHLWLFLVFCFLSVFAVGSVGFLAYTIIKQSPGSVDLRAKESLDPSKVGGAVLVTNFGKIEIKFDKTGAPNTVSNFIKLADEGFYDGTRFHRIVKGFAIQGGDPLSKDKSLVAQWGHGGPGYTFADEIHSEDQMLAGTLVMANEGKDSNGSQFLILTADSSWLNGQNTIFAKVVLGMDVVLAIGNLDAGVTGIPSREVVLSEIILK